MFIVLFMGIWLIIRFLLLKRSQYNRLTDSYRDSILLMVNNQESVTGIKLLRLIVIMFMVNVRLLQ